LSAASSTKVASVSGEAVLENTFGVYESNGIVYTEFITPSPLYSWETLRVAADVPVNTDYAIRFYTGTGTGPFTLIPDGDLPGNGVGFTDSLVDISMIDTVTYPSITAGITLETSDTTRTPAIDEVEIFYTQSQAPRSATSYDIVSTKTIGINSSSDPIYKYDTSFTTDGSGEYEITDLEFDQYTIENQSGFDVASACPAYPYRHQAGIDGELSFTLVSNDTNTARVQVTDGLNRNIPGAEVTLSRPGYNQTIKTDVCGQAFFTGGVSINNDYSIDITSAGYLDVNLTGIEIAGDVTQTIIMTD